MNLRLRLALIFFVLSALPVATLAILSYRNSIAAVRRAAEAEAHLAARDLEGGMERVASGLAREVRTASSLSLPEGKAVDSQAAVQLAERLRGALPFLEGIEFVAHLPGAPAAPANPALPAPRARPASPASPAAPAPPASPAAPAASPEAIAAVDALRLKAALAPLAQFSLGAPLSDAKRAELEKQLAAVGKEIGIRVAEEARQRVDLSRRVTETRIQAKAAAGTAPPPAAEPEITERIDVAGATQRVSSPLASDVVACPITSGETLLGELRAKWSVAEILRRVLRETHRDRGEVPFALDPKKTLYVATSEDGDALKRAGFVAGGSGAEKPANWVVVTRKDDTTGYEFGIARPLGKELAELRASTLRTLFLGDALILFALVAMWPLTRGLVRDVRTLENGATRIASGDLTARVPVRAKDEFGRLAKSFNRMAEQLSEHQEKLLTEERRRRAQELERRLLEAENERKSRELEEARDFQLSLLPRELPVVPGLELAAAITTATEVGGDYYDFLREGERRLVLAVGDATGHGAAAGTMVTAVKGLFVASGGTLAPAAFLRHATRTVHRMGLVRRAMALAIAHFDGREVALSSAGMPPALLFRAATGAIEELTLPGTPLGARPDFTYEERRFTLAEGDALLFVSDGLPELPNEAGEPLGYERVRSAFVAVAQRSASEVLAELAALAKSWRGGEPPADDMTFLVVRATHDSAAAPREI